MSNCILPPELKSNCGSVDPVVDDVEFDVVFPKLNPGVEVEVEVAPRLPKENPVSFFSSVEAGVEFAGGEFDEVSSF
ncbi:hypothetical protein TRFO_05995 [Tritrichomonas foetus]|uniref:Uncharacterized protein n=1 Tax=Tritrichomonas foetus TaxID=1144522 RepID=A0A1J4K1S6_9EUKA|nr:hypothetical protein TRFO_05995 [Tritrichomonas foetus]|eukprot:OHT05393.1 hypothetical protein TRFO_05995 [Tritrichomonas foetus]